MMLRDIEDWVFFAVIIGALAVIVFIFLQSGKIDDCYKRGGHVVDTSQGWVCAKLERV